MPLHQYLYAMYRRLLALLLVFFSAPCVLPAATYVYDYNSNCSKAYQYYTSLHLKEGHAVLLNEIRANPYNLMATYLADYEDCITLLMNCDKEEYNQRAAHLDERLALLDHGDPSSPWYRFCKAGLYLHWAIADIRFGAQYKAALKFKKSFALLKENEDRFPAFAYNNVFTGLEQAVVGSLPGSYKWLASVFGLRGNVKKGTDQLAAFINTHSAGQPLYEETVLYYLYTRFYLLAEQKEVWNWLNSPRFSTQNNLLNTFAKANIALDYRHADDALATLQSAGNDAGYSNYPVFYYQYGAALLTRSDTACVKYFQLYLKNNKSDIYIKDAWQKMAFAWYVNGNSTKAEYCLAQIKSQGDARLDADKQALRFAERHVWPQRGLLQARLLIDGGYYERALTILRHISETSLTNPADKAEYFFRLGRVYEESAASGDAARNTKLAFENYRLAIITGKDRREQFAARAALQMGKMYERLDMKSEAINEYKTCLDMPAHDFQNSIDQQAKAGINRVSGE